MSPRLGSPNTSSESSISPSSSLSRLRTVSFISSSSLGALGGSRRLPQRGGERQALGRPPLRRIFDEDKPSGTAGNRSLDHQNAAFGIGCDDLEALGGYP